MDVYKFFATGAATLDAAASLDIRRDGHIVAMLGDLHITGADALDDGGGVEISFASGSGFVTNDTTGSVFTLRAGNSFLTSGGGLVGKSESVSGIAIEVFAGERMYMHLTEFGSIAAISATVYLYVMSTDAGSDRAAPRRRL